MNEIYEKAKEAVEFLQSQGIKSTNLSIVTGSGINEIISDYEIVARVPFSDIPHLVSSTFHKGEILYCRFQNKEFIVLNGRLHYYEGYSAQEITFPIRILSLLDVKRLILTNASGGLNPEYQAGEIVLIKDHINLMPEHPLRGSNDERFGDRFPDMSDVYDKELRQQIIQYAQQEHFELFEGVYAGFQGPSLETPSENKFIHTIGADMVGMSTVPEAIVANHCNMEIIGLSIVTNQCYPPDRIKKTTVEDVIRTAQQAIPKLSKIINKLILNT